MLCFCFGSLAQLRLIFLEQRVDNDAIAHKEEQKVINNTPILTIPRITETLAIMQSCYPTAKGTLKNTPCLHQQTTRINTPGIIPVPTLLPTVPPATQPIATYHPLPSNACLHIVTHHAINALMATKFESCHNIFTPNCLSVTPMVTSSVQPEHFAYPMVHPVTGETISSYKGLMNDPATTKTGKLHLIKILEVCCRATTRQARMAQTQCLSCHMIRYDMC